jgi:hypothetical protein
MSLSKYTNENLPPYKDESGENIIYRYGKPKYLDENLQVGANSLPPSQWK